MKKKEKDADVLTDSPEHKNLQVINFIKETCANFYNMDASLYETKSRKAAFLKVKHIAIYLTRQNTLTTTLFIGAAFKCDHSSVIHAWKKIKDHASWDKDLRKELAELERLIRTQAVIVRNGYDEDNGYYYVDMNDFHSIKHESGKSVILVGFKPEDLERMEIMYRNKDGVIEKFFKGPKPIVEHTATGMYVLKKIKDGDNKDIHSRV